MLRILEILHDGERKRFSNTRVPSIEQSPIPLQIDTNSLDWNYVFSKLKRDHSYIRNATNFRDITQWRKKKISKYSIEPNPIPLQIDTNSLDWNYIFSKLKRDHFYIRILEILYNGERKRFLNIFEQSPIPLHTDTNSLDWNYVFSKLKRDHSCIRNEFYRYYTMEE